MRLTPQQQRRVLAHLANRLQMRASTAQFKWLSARAYEWMGEYIRTLVPQTSDLRNVELELTLREIVRPQLTRRSVAVSPDRVRAGQLVFFRYKATTVSVYDRFPCTMVIRPVTVAAPGTFFGVNFHYLPPVIRLIWFDTFLNLQALPIPRRSMSIEVASRIIADTVHKYPIVAATYHQYRVENCESPALLVPQEEWMYALSMPVERPTVPVEDFYDQAAKRVL
jgi:hypothetical protein